MESSENEKDVLMEFLSFTLQSSEPILEKFSKLSGAIVHIDGEKKNFVYVPGSREDRVVLVAHSDTVWDIFWKPFLAKRKNLPIPEPDPPREHHLIFEDGIFRQGGSNEWGIGADDRAGCAMLWLLRNSGHSLLITDGEEHGQIGANHLMNNYPEIADELNSHRYMIQLDRREATGFKSYNIPVTKEFHKYIEEQTHYTDVPNSRGRTDIIPLCRNICGVNFSVGYYDEHKPFESLIYDEWLHTLQMVRKLLQKEQPYFPLEHESNTN